MIQTNCETKNEPFSFGIIVHVDKHLQGNRWNAINVKEMNTTEWSWEKFSLIINWVAA